MMRVSFLRRPSSLLLLAAALLALAVLFAPGAQPALADHGGDDTVTVWSGTMTVGNGVGGCGLSSDDCGSVLSDDDFTYRGTDYEVEKFNTLSGSLVFELSAAIPSGIAVRVGTSEFAIANATLSNNGQRATWSSSGLNFSGGNSRTVTLSLTAPRPSGVVLSTETLAINEDSVGSDTFTIALADDPGTSTTVTLVRTQFFQNDYGESDRVWDLNAATVSPETLTFTSSNYSEAQTVTVSGVEDLDGCDEQLLILVLVQTAAGSGSENPEYTPVGGSGNSVTGVFVTVDDDDSGQGCGGV